jgi:hypothetical protein
MIQAKYPVNPLSLDALQQTAPAIFADEPDLNVSDKYRFVPTTEVLGHLDARGWRPYAATQQVNHKGVARVHGMHTVSLLYYGSDYEIPELREGAFRMVLVNSHDRTRRFSLVGGIIRFICSNGLIAGSNIQQVRFTHVMGNNVVDDLDAQIGKVIEHTTKAAMNLDRWGKIKLRPELQTSFAEEALQARYGSYEPPVAAADVLVARRKEDKGNDLWNTFNRVQENIIKGGLLTRSGRHTKPIVSAYEDLTINAKLWELAESYAN